jgi:HK97 family phage major capsid protein/HK97 family phage prohead protease
MKIERAYSTLDLKSVGNDDERIIEGIATTPSTDRQGDIVVTEGIEFKLPLPLLWQHNHSQPIGEIFEAKVTKSGMRIKARIAKIPDEGSLKNRIDEAWHSVKNKLVRGLSIGFRTLEHAYMDDGYGIKFIKTELLEISAVTIPANADASIAAIKSIDEELLAASGKPAVTKSKINPGASGTKDGKPVSVPKQTVKGKSSMNIAEQIKAFQEKRVAAIAAMEALMTEAAEAGETLNAETKEAYDEHDAEVKSIDEHLVRLSAFQKRMAEKATPVPATAGTDPEVATEVRAGGASTGVISVRENLGKGIEFARYVKCLAAARGNARDAADIAKARYPDLHRVQNVLKAAVAAGTTTDATWAGSLVDYQNFAGDFVEFLRPQTIIGKFGTGGVPALRQVPFNVKIPGQTSGGSASWVGEGAPKPLTKFDFANVELRWAKVANIAVLTDELVRFSSPAADALVRDALAAAIVERIDIDFVDPAKAVEANVSPASITNGATSIASSGSDAAAIRADVQKIFATFIAANMTPSSGVWIMNATTALALSQFRNALGQREFDGITMNGGTFEGMPVIVSQYISGGTGSPVDDSIVILVNASDIYFADDGQVVVDASREASLQMLDNPTNNSSTGTATSMVSMFQTNSIAIRAERFINWQRRRAAAVAYLTGVNYTG